jgi:hypothetical protein
MSHYISTKQEGKRWQLKINDFKEPLHLEVDDEQLKKSLPRDNDLYIIRSASTRMDIGDYFFFRPADLKYEIEIRRVR